MALTDIWILSFVLILFGLLSGFISVLAGGGVTVILPILLAVGLTPPMANGTSRVSLAVGALLATYLLSRKKLICWRKMWPLFLVSGVGSILGAYIATLFTIHMTSDIILITCVASLVLICTKPHQWLKARVNKPSTINLPVWFYMLYFVLCIYGGIIAVDSAIIRLAALVLLISLPLNEANIIKVVTGLPLFLISAIVYAVHGEVDYTSAGFLSIGTIVGALIATQLMGNTQVRVFAYILLFVVVISGTIYLLSSEEALLVANFLKLIQPIR